MLKQGPAFHFEIAEIRNKRVQDNEVRLYEMGSQTMLIVTSQMKR